MVFVEEFKKEWLGYTGQKLSTKKNRQNVILYFASMHFVSAYLAASHISSRSEMNSCLIILVASIHCPDHQPILMHCFEAGCSVWNLSHHISIYVCVCYLCKFETFWEQYDMSRWFVWKILLHRKCRAGTNCNFSCYISSYCSYLCSLQVYTVVVTSF